MTQSTFSAQVANNLLTLLQGYSKNIRFLLVMFLTLTASAEVWAETVTYTVSSTSAVTKSGTAPDGSSATYKSTYSNAKCQLTANNSMTLTLSGYDGCKITGLTLSMKSNSSKGSGNMSMEIGNTTISSIATAKFSNNTWNGSWSTSYVNVTPSVTATTVGNGEKIEITIAATENSLYCQSFTITYETSGGGVTPDPCTTPTVAWNTKPANGEVGGSMTASVTTNYSNGLTYSSSNQTVATVTNAGVINYLSAGTTTITATVTGDGTTFCEGPVSVQQEITVTAPAGGGDGECSWEETAIGNIEDDDIVVITMTTSNGTTYAMSNDNGTGSAPAATTVTVSGSTLTSDIADNLKWNIINNTGSLTIYPNGTTSTWLYCTGTNNGVRVGTNDDKTFTIDATSGYLKHSNTSRYVGVYTTNPDWRCYTSTTTNIANQTLKFYVYKCDGGGGDEPTPTQLTKPTNLKVSDVTTTTVTLSWGAVANANGYTVVVGSTSHNTNTTSITVENLTASTTYKWSVTAKGNGSTYTDSDAANGSDFTTKTPAPANYTVTLNPNYPAGKTGTFKNIEGNTVNGNLEISLPANTESQPIANLYSSISLEGYVFEGWYEAADGNANRTNTGTITQDITFYAHWKEPYTVTFEAGTGSCDKESITETTANGITLPTATLTDCGDWVFLGWAEAAIASETTTAPTSFLAGGSTYKPTSNITLYAIYKRVEGGGSGEGAEATLSFADKAQRTTYTTTQQIWEQNGITLTNNKASSTSNVGDYANPARFYAKSEIIIEALGNITQIVATTSGANYATALVNSANTEASADGNVVTITPTTSNTTYTIAQLSAQVQMSSITVTYGGGLSTSYYHSNPVCQTCENILTISKGTETNGTFTLDISGNIETCETEVSVVVKPTSANHYHIGSVTATTPTTGGAPTVIDNDNGTYTITYAANSTGTSTINVTFAEDAKATIKLSELGETTIDNSTYYVGEQCTLPTNSSQSCEGKELVGWSTKEVIETDTKPTENYYELGAEVTLEAEQTFYAVFAKPTGNGGAQGELFSESFETIEGSGGNDGKWDGNIASAQLTEYGDWEFTYAYKGDECIKLGKASGQGQATTPALGINGSATLTFKAGAWNGNSENLTITLQIVGEGSIEPSSITLTTGQFNTYTANITGANADTKVQFIAATKNDNRFFLDEVKVSGGTGNTTYTDYSTFCGTYTVTFYGFNRGGCTTTCGENPAEIEVAQGATYTIPNCVPNDPAGLGRTFAGTWNTQADGQGSQYKPGEGFTVDSDITLFAQWKLETTGDVELPTDVVDLATTDIVVTGGTTLTLQEGTTTINSLTLEGGRTNDDYLMPAIYSDGEASVELNNKTIPFDLSVDKAHYYPFAVPFPVAVSDVDYADPTLASASVYGTHYVIKRYDGAMRADKGENKNANWVKVEESETLQPGIGYIITAVPIGGEALIRFPMSPEQLWLSEDKTVYVEAHTGAASDAEYRHAGWNFIANPYLSRFAGVNVGNENNLLNGVLNYVNGEWQTTGEVPYVTIPAPDFTYYEQVELDDAILSPSYAFFVQAAHTAALSFATTGRQQNMPALRAASKGPLRLPLTISQSTQSDRTTLLVSDDYTTAYEIGKDLEKMFGSAEYLTLYSLMANQTPLAFCATPWSSAVQSIPLGYRTNKSGSVTITLDASTDMSDAEMVLLYDAVTGMTTNLLINSYTFETEMGTHDARFTVMITPKQGATTGCEEVMLPTDGTYKFIENGQLYINHKGVVYTVEGRENW